jgi:hypothetical protein
MRSEKVTPAPQVRYRVSAAVEQPSDLVEGDSELAVEENLVSPRPAECRLHLRYVRCDRPDHENRDTPRRRGADRIRRACPDAGWRALTVFGAELAVAADRNAAEAEVEAAGLAVLAERWWYRDGEHWVPAVIQEAGPERVTALVGTLTDLPRPITLTGGAAAALRRRAGGEH